MDLVCPSCATTHSCPDMLAGVTICCRKCRTQITVPEEAGRRARHWFQARYWRRMGLAELLVLAALAACVLLLARARPPADLPFLDPGTAGGPHKLAVPGAPLTLFADTGIEAAGGHFIIVGQNVRLAGSSPFQIQDVQVRENGWECSVFQPGQAPPPAPIVLELRLRLPDDEILEGEEVALHVVTNLEYPGWSRPGAPVSLQKTTVTRAWPFVVATKAHRAAFRSYVRHRGLLQAGAAGLGALAVALAAAAGLFAQRHINIQCPDCGRVTIATYYQGGSKLHMSPCPHKGSRPVEHRRRSP